MRPRLARLLFTVAGFLFVLAALIPAFRGGRVNIVFIVLGIAFVVLSLTFRGGEPNSEEQV